MKYTEGLTQKELNFVYVKGIQVSRIVTLNSVLEYSNNLAFPLFFFFSFFQVIDQNALSQSGCRILHLTNLQS